ncbi:hypothetical protein K1719_039603 [Acacia pycnantha]|nr:hypothetical protein K1719_039603 [Acacia pycnantha]
MVVADDEWWERKIKENKAYENIEEGSGDSEEELQGITGGSVQVPTDLEGMNLTSNTQPSAPSGSASIGKRKRGCNTPNF